MYLSYAAWSSGQARQSKPLLSLLCSAVLFYSFNRSQAGTTVTQVEASFSLVVKLSRRRSCQFRCSLKATLVGVLHHTLPFFHCLRGPSWHLQFSSLSRTFSKWTEGERLPEWVLRATSTWRHSNRRRLSQLTSASLVLAITSARSSSCLYWSHNRAYVSA